jgi:hypothetical protein
MKFTLTALLVLVAVANAAPNFQQRRLYYNEKDNVCSFGTGFDQAELFITIDGALVRQTVVKSGLFCRVWAWTNADRVAPSPKWSYFTQDATFKFDEETVYHRIGAFVLFIDVRTTLRSPAVFAGKEYDCTIVGDGKIYHFGAEDIEFPPPQMQISCTSTLTQTQ